MLCRKILQDLPIIWKIFLNLRKELEKVEKTSAPIGLWQNNILMSEILLDAVDLQILRALQENARLTTKELAARVNLSTTPVFERLKRLERGGFILKYVAVLDAEKLGRGFTVFCSVKLKQMNRNVAKNFISVIRDIPQVAECYNISGEYDYLLKIQAPDMKYYNEFIINVLGTIDSIGSILSSFVMDEIKNTHALYL